MFYFFLGTFEIILVWKELILLLRIRILSILMLCKDRKKEAQTNAVKYDIMFKSCLFFLFFITN